MDPEERAKNIRQGTIFQGGGLDSLDNNKMLEITKLEFDETYCSPEKVHHHHPVHRHRVLQEVLPTIDPWLARVREGVVKREQRISEKEPSFSVEDWAAWIRIKY